MEFTEILFIVSIILGVVIIVKFFKMSSNLNHIEFYLKRINEKLNCEGQEKESE